jgi:hypothetical protein
MRLTTCGAVLAVATLVACSGGVPPELDGLTDQVAEVGTELVISLDGTSSAGGQLTYDYHAADLTDLTGNADLTVSPSGAGVFRWTPLADDVGSHPFDFSVSNGGATTTVTININVKSAIGSSTAPVFREPLGTGTTFDPTTTPCLTLDIVIEDSDTPMVTIAQEQPLIDGATITAVDGQDASWKWCPTAAQIAGDDRYTLALSADDMDNPKTMKQYLIVLRNGDGSSCPGSPPVIAYTPANVTTRLDLAPTATITDDKGLKDDPLFYYSTTNPGATPNLTAMTQISMPRASGTATNGTYTADVPNPVASAADGTQATLYYVIVATDDDDTSGSCDHTTQSPVYSVVVTAGGGATAGLCQPCSADSQCGANNECVYIGSEGLAYCLQACSTGCPTGYSCSAANVDSIDGAEALQCEPTSGSCVASSGTCADDDWEVNDSRSEASANPVMTPSTYDLVSCPSTTDDTRANDDWYKIVLTSSQRVDLLLQGDGAMDLDLHLYHSDGTVVSASTSPYPDEEISQCLPPLTYYVKVDGYGSARSLYSLSYTSTDETCDTTCVDDANEDDDTFSQARATTYPTYTSTANQICPNDDDWYGVLLFTGDVMTIDLTFTQNDPSGDLDLHLYENNDTDLWPCSADDPDDCQVAHGQGSVSNEHATFTAPSSCDDGCIYDVVVRGFDGAQNAYDINIGID